MIVSYTLGLITWLLVWSIIYLNWLDFIALVHLRIILIFNKQSTSVQFIKSLFKQFFGFEIYRKILAKFAFS